MPFRAAYPVANSDINDSDRGASAYMYHGFDYASDDPADGLPCGSSGLVIDGLGFCGGLG